MKRWWVAKQKSNLPDSKIPTILWHCFIANILIMRDTDRYRKNSVCGSTLLHFSGQANSSHYIIIQRTRYPRRNVKAHDPTRFTRTCTEVSTPLYNKATYTSQQTQQKSYRHRSLSSSSSSSSPPSKPKNKPNTRSKNPPFIKPIQKLSQ